MQYRILTREPLMRFLALTHTRADARLRAPGANEESISFLAAVGNVQH